MWSRISSIRPPLQASGPVKRKIQLLWQISRRIVSPCCRVSNRPGATPLSGGGVGLGVSASASVGSMESYWWKAFAAVFFDDLVDEGGEGFEISFSAIIWANALGI